MREPIWERVLQCARELTREGKVPFTRGDLILCIQRNDPNCNPGSINPIIQGMTDNLRGGAPGSVDKDLLHSVGRGLFVLNADKRRFTRENSTKKEPNQLVHDTPSGLQSRQLGA